MALTGSRLVPDNPKEQPEAAAPEVGPVPKPASEILVEFTGEASYQVGRAGGEVETVTFAKGDVAKLPHEIAAMFVGNGRAKESKKKAAR